MHLGSRILQIEKTRWRATLPAVGSPFTNTWTAVAVSDTHEEFLDAGHLYQPRKKLLRDEDTNKSWLQDLGKRISTLGYESWAREFQLAVDSNKSNIPDAVRGKASNSYILAPGLFDSYLKNKLIRWLARNELRF